MAVSSTAHFLLEPALLRDWIIKARTGDQAAFEHLLVTHERMVLGVAQRLLLDAEDAKDAAQEVFLRLHRNLSRFREDKDFIPWLYRMTVNICLDSKRRSKPRVSLDQTAETPANSPTPEETLHSAQQRALVLEALRKLPERERLSIVLRDLEGRPTAEVAALLGTTETTVRSQISTGRARIRKLLSEHMGARK